MLRCLRSALPVPSLRVSIRRPNPHPARRALSEAVAAMDTHNQGAAAPSSSSHSLLRDPAYGRFREQCLGRYGLSGGNLDSVVALLEGGSTVPFIVRYRNYVIGSMDAEGTIKAYDR